MKRFLFCVAAVSALAIFIYACNKTVSPPITYSVSNDTNDSAMEDVYIPDSGTYQMNTLVKFIQAPTNNDYYVELVLSGVPAGIKVSPDTFNAVPTYTDPITFSDSAMAQGVYPVTLTAYTRNGLPQVYKFNIHVIPVNCAAAFQGNLTGVTACTSRSFTHIATGSLGGYGVLIVNNFGGYGTACNVVVNLNCDSNTLSIADSTYGNGVKLHGSGTYSADSMVINYSASSTPTGGPESCTVIYKP